MTYVNTLSATFLSRPNRFIAHVEVDGKTEITHKFALCGVEMDGRKYNPHITLGREVRTDVKPWIFEPFGETVFKIDLMKSERIGGKLTYMAIYERSTK